MCGLAGMMGPDIKSDDHKFMKNLLFVTSLRGVDSTGVMIAGFGGKKKWIEIEKEAIPASYWLRKDWLKQTPMLEDYTADIFLAHCRDATVGSINEANAHPFNLPTLVGAHNGTLVDSKYRGTSKTDSEEMFTEMNRIGVLPTLENLSQNSAYAISVYHKDTTNVTLARNKKRPLWIGLNLDRKVIYWASEENMLTLCAERNGINLKAYYLIPDKLYKFDVKKITGGDHVQWDCEDVVYKTPPPKPIQSTIFYPKAGNSTNTSTTRVETTTTINGKPVVRIINPIGRIEEHDVEDYSDAPQFSESYFDDVFEKILKNEATKSVEPLTFSQGLTEADFDHEGNPLPHVKAPINSHAELERVFNKGSAVMNIHPEDDGPNYAAHEVEEEMWWDEQCTICNKFLKTEKDRDEATLVVIDGANYYSCQECENEMKERTENQRRRRMPEIDEVTTH